MLARLTGSNTELFLACFGGQCPTGHSCYQNKCYRTGGVCPCGAGFTCVTLDDGTRECIDLNTGSAMAPNRTCTNIARNCVQLSYLCNNTIYANLMTQQCGATCGRCTGENVGTSQCVDLSQPGRPSDCPANRNLCQNSNYRTLMAQQCRKTCGYC